jgi:hypothetical protein
VRSRNIDKAPQDDGERLLEEVVDRVVREREIPVANEADDVPLGIDMQQYLKDDYDWLYYVPERADVADVAA